jgi:hypothetical protein
MCDPLDDFTLLGVRSHSNPHAFVFIERELVAAPVIEFRGARRRMVGHGLRVLERALAFEIVGNAGGTQRVIANCRFDAGLFGPPLDHTIGVRLRHALRCTGRAAGRAEQGPILVAGDVGRRNILIQKVSNLW